MMPGTVPCSSVPVNVEPNDSSEEDDDVLGHEFNDEIEEDDF